MDLPPGSYDSRVPVVVAVTVLGLSIATAAVVLRTYTRRWIVRQMGVDDYFAIAALLMAYGCGVAILCMTQYGLGTHLWMIHPAFVPLYQRTFYVSIVLYCAGLFAAKMTFLLQYYRVFAVQKLRSLFLLAILLVGGWSLSQVLVAIFTCHPISAYWDRGGGGSDTHPQGGPARAPTTAAAPSCIPDLPQWYVNAAGNILTDVAIFVLPLPILGRLNLPRTQRLVLIGVFSLGFFTVAVSVIRIKYLKLFADFTWDNVESSSWSISELCAGITCACLPTLWPFVTRHIRHADSPTATALPVPAVGPRSPPPTYVTQEEDRRSDPPDHDQRPSRSASSATLTRPSTTDLESAFPSSSSSSSSSPWTPTSTPATPGSSSRKLSDGGDARDVVFWATLFGSRRTRQPAPHETVGSEHQQQRRRPSSARTMPPQQRRHHDDDAAEEGPTHDRLRISQYGGRSCDNLTALIGLRPTVQTTVAVGSSNGGGGGVSSVRTGLGTRDGTGAGTPPRGNVIQVQRDVYQVMQPRPTS